MSDTGHAPSLAMGPTPDDAAEILDAAPDTILVIDSELRLVWANSAAERFFGRTLADADGVFVVDFIHPEDLQMAHLSFESVLDKEAGSLIEVRLNSAHGWRLVEVRGAPYRDGVVLAVRDITARRRWEVAGNEVERSRTLMQNSATLTFLLDVHGTVIASGGAIPRLLGLDQERIEGVGFTSLIDPDDVAAFDTALATVTQSSTRSVAVDVGMLDGRQTIVPHAMTLTDLLDDPTIEGVLVSGHDVSDRAEVERRLRDTVSVLAATLESTADAVLVVGSDGSISSYNRRFVEMWRFDPDVLPSMSGADVLAKITAQVVDPASIGVVLESVRTQVEFETHGAIELLDARIIEGNSLPQYVHGKVTGRVWTFRDITEERRLRDQLAHQAFHDSLTGLANQALLYDRLNNAAARLARSGGELAVLYIDLDDFKRVNDHLGHHVGDDLLVGISRRIESCLRAGDTASRLGGDEFAVLLDDLGDRGDARRVADRIVSALRVPTATSGGDIAVRASIGIAYGNAETDAEDVLRHADRAMYEAKAMGRNTVREFSPDMLVRGISPASGVDVAELIARDELEVVYQPILEMPHRRVVAMEAFVRWRHPSRGLLTPGQFLGPASSMAEVDRFVLQRACDDAAGWSSGGTDGEVAVCVNLSAGQISEPGLASLIYDTLSSTGLRASRLMLDVAESAVMADPAAARTQFECLVGLGVSVAMDDFGTGATSLAHLAELPIEVLKIDRSFLQMTLSDDRWTVVEALLMVTSSLGVLPIAEGVESEQEVESLLELGCRTMQGFHLARPLESDRVAEYLVGDSCDLSS